VVDSDYSEWAVDVTMPGRSGPERWWREDRMDALLAEECGGSLFVAGCVSNQGKFYHRFDAVVLLSVPVVVLLERIATRVTNEFGKTHADRERILNDLDLVEPLLRRTATVEIDTSRPLSDVVDAVESVARRTGPPLKRGVYFFRHGPGCKLPMSSM
jgi:hypothetical protein